MIRLLQFADHEVWMNLFIQRMRIMEQERDCNTLLHSRVPRTYGTCRCWLPWMDFVSIQVASRDGQGISLSMPYCGVASLCRT